MRKIAFVINSLQGKNGACIFLINLLLTLKKYNNLNIILISLYDNPDKYYIDKLKENNISVFFCHKKGNFDTKCSKRFKNILSEFNPDIVNIHLGVLVTYFISFKFSNTKWKLVKTFHSIPGQDLNKINLFLEKKYIKKGLISFIGISKLITNKFKEKYPCGVIKTIYNGIPINKNQKQENKEYDFIIVASLEPVKNHMLLFTAFKSFLNDYKDSKLLVVGKGSKESEYKHFVNSNNLEKNIIFIGETNNVFEFLNKSKIFILSSIREGNPISILEAMSLGLPIIAPNIGGIPDIVTNNENGLLYQMNDFKELFSCMNNLFADNKFYNKVVVNNLCKSNEFSIENTANEYLKYFRELTK